MDHSCPPRLLDRVRDCIRLKHYSLRTEQAYLVGIKRFIPFHGKRLPDAMAAAEVELGFNRWMQHTKLRKQEECCR